MFPRFFAIAALFVGLPIAAMAAPERPVVVELFTSQGCSSCPPADTYLSELSRERSDVLPLAFHVTYWNTLGWKDPFSFDGATQRQATYAARFGDGSYTPEMVIDGRTGLVGSNRGRAEAVIAGEKQAGMTSAAVSAIQAGKDISITVSMGSGSARVVLIGYDAEHRTAIGRGENSGRTLTEHRTPAGLEESAVGREARVIDRMHAHEIRIGWGRGLGGDQLAADVRRFERAWKDACERAFDDARAQLLEARDRVHRRRITAT